MPNVTQVKICGITNTADALVAIEAGADLLGFILYPKSPRYMAAARVREIVEDVRLKIEDWKIEDWTAMQAGRDSRLEAEGWKVAGAKEVRSSLDAAGATSGRTSNLPSSIFRPPRFVGVFVNATPAKIDEVMTEAGLDLAQLHGDETPAVLAALAGRAYKALRPADAAQARDEAARFVQPDKLPSLLVDAYDPAEYGGTGKKADWHVAAELAAHSPGLLLAGGLTPHNVAAAIAQVKPWGVDVASGVELAPGRKDHAAVRAFIQTVKQGNKAQ